MPVGMSHHSHDRLLSSKLYVQCTMQCKEVYLQSVSAGQGDSGQLQEQKFKTGKSGDSGDGVHGGGDAHAAAPLVRAPLHTTEGWASPSHALSPQLVLLKSLRPGSPGSPWNAACACGMGLWVGVVVSG